MPVENFSLAVTNAEGADMLDPKTIGYYSSKVIKISYKQGGTIKYTDVRIREPFAFGQGGKFPYYSMVSSELADLKIHKRASSFSIDFGDKRTYEIVVDDKAKTLKVNGEQLVADASLPESFGKVYYLVKEK